MKGSLKKIFGRSKKRSSLDNGSGSSCHSSSNPSHSDPSGSGSQDLLSKPSERGNTKRCPTQGPSNDFTLPAESSLYTFGDDLESRAFRDSSSLRRSRVDNLLSSSLQPQQKQQQRAAGLEPIASESNLHVEDDPDVTEATDVASNCALRSFIPSTIVAPSAEPVSIMEDDYQSSGMIDMIGESPEHSKAYDLVPVLEQTKLPRGGVSIETKAVGRVQFGIPPETIKDSMRLGIPVPQVYIVPTERFCREMGPALGVNLAEFEFPAYFNFFVYKKRCTLIVDSEDAEENIRRVFSETLLGPAQFRRAENPLAYEEEDFAPDFPREAIPDFQKEFKHFRIMPDGKELVIETLLNFCHFESRGGGHDNLGVPPPVEGSFRAPERTISTASSVDTDEEDEALPKDLTEVERREMKKNKWTYSQAKFVGDVAVIWPFDATEDQIKSRSVPRVEVFKMPGGTEYMLHDVDANNFIVGKARVSGHVRVSEFMSVEGFGGHSILDDVVPRPKADRPDYFHPPSFGVTVLGNSHGFDKSGSVSGYVLWINGRGVMIDPPPYSSATLEREGIRPRAIVGIILTHCHADHDAGAFQKVLTGSPVVVITTPTIYKSFIRKYAALSALSPALLRHSHRYKPAIIGQPLRFQGATFHFTYTLHTIPCVGFRVEWRGRSMVFTGDHFNSPPAITKLTETGVLSQARADDLSNLPLQDTDLLLHEAGAPPIHTPLDVLLQLPEHVKKRLYVVHTSALPEGCELRVAPTGTAGTIRLDQSQLPNTQVRVSRAGRDNVSATGLAADEFTWSGQNEYNTISEDPGSALMTSLASVEVSGHRTGKGRARATSVFTARGVAPPLVSLRPASSTDAWFILNLLSAVPFLSSLSYAATMEVLETARVDAYSMGDIIVPAARRANVLCVIWEGMCAERKASLVSHRPPSSSSELLTINEDSSETESNAVWHPGDWTGPIVLQPERRLSGESSTSYDHDVVAVSSVGVKVITVEFAGLHRILKNGSPLYRKHLDRKAIQERVNQDLPTYTDHSQSTEKLLEDALRDLNILELLNCNSALRKLTAVQKRHLESLAEGPIVFQPGERLWRAGTPVDKAFIIVSGTASFAPKRRNAGSALVTSGTMKDRDKDKLGDPQIGEAMQADALKAMKELGVGSHDHGKDDESSVSSVESEQRRPSHIQFDSIFSKSGLSGGAGPGGAVGGGAAGTGTERRGSALSESHDYDRLSRGLQKRADYLQKEGGGSVTSENMSVEDHEDLDSCETETESMLDFTFTDEHDPVSRSRRVSVIRRRSSRARFANKVLGRLYSRRAFTGGLVFSRGHFLGDVSKMVAGLLSSEGRSSEFVRDDGAPSYGFGDHREGHPPERDRLFDSVVSDMVIHEQEEDHYIMHSSTLTAGKDGCVVLVFPKSSLIPFMDEYPGLLLSLLGTQVVV